MNDREIFMAALDKATPQDRDAYLDRACGDDAPLRRRVEALLASYEDAGDFLERPAVAGDATEALNGWTDGDPPWPSSHREAEPRDPLDNDVSLAFLKPCDVPGRLGMLGQYEVVDVVGRGGMGAVLRAHDPKLNRVVAVKVLAPQVAANATARKRFLREAQAAAAVSHPHVVTIHAVEETDRTPYLVMEYVDGLSLRDKIERVGHLELKEILRIGAQIASGLAAAHGHGLIHRDIKPGNILLENGVERVRITDFGLARAVDDVGLTLPGEVAGTPQYMAPEQAQGRPVDHRADLFSLGAVMYAMCTGRSPFRADTTVAVIRRVCDEEPRPIRDVNPEVPESLEQIVDRLLAKRPEDRFASASEVADLLARHLAHVQDPVNTPSPQPVPRASSASRMGPRVRSSRPWLIAVAVLLSALGGLGLTEATGVTHVAEYLGTVLRIRTPQGTLVLQIDDPAVKVSIEGNGEDVTISGAGVEELHLRPGQYQLRATRNGEPVREELVTITRNGRKIVTVTLESTVAPQGAEGVAPEIPEIRRLKGPTSNITSLAVSPTGHVIASGSFNKIHLFEWDTEKPRHVIEGQLGVMSGLLFTSDGSHILSASQDRTIRLWNVESGREVRQFVGHEDWVMSVSLSPDEQTILSCAKDGTIRLWSRETAEPLRTIAVKGDGERKRVLQVQFSADGRRFASSHADGTVTVWNAETGAEIATIPAYVKAAHSVRFSRDDTRLLTCGNDDVACLWELSSRRRLKSFRHRRNVLSAEFTSDGRHVVTGSGDQTLRVWDIESGREVARATAPTHCTQVVALTPDGRHAVSGGGLYPVHRNGEVIGFQNDGDNDLHVWRLPESVWPQGGSATIGKPNASTPALGFREIARFDGYTHQVFSLAFSSDARGALVGPGHPIDTSQAPDDSDFDVRLVDLESGSEQRRLSGHTSPVLSVAFSPDDRFALTADFHTVQVRDVETGRKVRSFEGVPGRFDCVTFSRDGRRALSGGSDRIVRLWNVDTKEPICELEGHKEFVWSVAISPDGSRALSAGGGVYRDGNYQPGSDHTIRLWDLETRRVLRHFRGHTGSVDRVAFSPDGRRALSGSYDKTVRLWDVETGEELACLRGHTANVSGVAFHPDGRHGVSIGHYPDGTMRLWDLDRGREICTVTAHAKGVRSVAVSPNGRYAITGGKVDGTVRLWRLPWSAWPANTVRDRGDTGETAVPPTTLKSEKSKPGSLEALDPPNASEKRGKVSENDGKTGEQ